MELNCIFCQSKLFQVLSDALICTNEEHHKENKNHWAYFTSINDVKVINTINIVSGKYQLCCQVDTNNTTLYEIINPNNGDCALKHILTIKDIEFIYHIKNEEEFLTKIKTLLLFM